MLIEISMLKNYPSTSLNRDQSGSPKTAFYGGVERGRISSQCIKRSIRESGIFSELGEKGIRTRQIGKLVKNELSEYNLTEEYIDVVGILLGKLGNDSTAVKSTTRQIIFYSQEDIKTIAKSIKELIDETETIEAFKKTTIKDLETKLNDSDTRPINIDIAVFGRMQTTSAFRIVDSSIQVAHAIGVNKLKKEIDYFTTIDDLPQSNNRAAMISDNEYNANCYYYYMAIDTDQLEENLESISDDPKLMGEIVSEIIRTFVFTNPSGKQNSFAGHVLPELVMVEVKKNKIPVNYINAFNKDIKATKTISIPERGIKQLVKEINTTDKKFALEIEKRIWLDVRDKATPKNAIVAENIEELIDMAKEAINK